jgi:hypothetical protein
MRKTIIGSFLLVAGITAGCSSTSTNNANIRGTNTNTGYVTNTETNAKPTIPANTTNIEPPSVGTNSNSGNSNHNSNMNSNTKKPS